MLNKFTSISPIKIASPISGRCSSAQSENLIEPSLIMRANLASSPLLHMILFVSNFASFRIISISVYWASLRSLNWEFFLSSATALFFLLVYILSNFWMMGAESSFSSPKVNQKSYFSRDKSYTFVQAITFAPRLIV